MPVSILKMPWQKKLLLAVIQNNNQELDRLIITHKTDLENSTCWLWEEAPLHEAAFSGREEMVRKLVAAGAKVNAYKVSESGYGMTPLHSAIMGKNIATIQSLVGLGADQHMSGKFKESMFSFWNGNCLDWAKKAGISQDVFKVSSQEENENVEAPMARQKAATKRGFRKLRSKKKAAALEKAEASASFKKASALLEESSAPLQKTSAPLEEASETPLVNSTEKVLSNLENIDQVKKELEIAKELAGQLNELELTWKYEEKQLREARDKVEKQLRSFNETMKARWEDLESKMAKVKQHPSFRTQNQMRDLEAQVSFINRRERSDSGRNCDCMVCFLKPAQIYVCQECENWICQACLGKVQLCPTCRANLTRRPMKRSKALERVLLG